MRSERQQIFIRACVISRDVALLDPAPEPEPSRAAAWAPWLAMLALFLLAVVRW